ncbi:rod shape-determining protein MreC [Lentibacillus cibarius]|uniref:Cell shape-determining protein MreC n=1 Tax=Lentibacillus cibarius TaxID=2583219 RepID=A0A549YLR9_9BACI|nr:rod shape-determining protein MreC [Lentibacillus cibarius]TRM12832.1 rod shape-determining protein MreC [Lentibacillus cibarius]
MSFFRKKRLFILLIGLIVLVAMIGFSLRDREDLTTAEQFIKDTVGWTQSIVHTPVDYVTTIFENINDIKHTYSENQLLREKIAEYKSLFYDVQKLREENSELRETLKKTKSVRSYNPIQASVISRSPEQWMEKVTINKGKQDGIRGNMAVITSEGMVGRIETPSEFTSSVKLLSGFDQFSRISATIARKEGNDIFGMIEGYDNKTGNLIFKIIEESDKDLKEGELVHSSGMGGVFPSGLPIGKVQEVKPDQYGLTRTAFVKPVANMYDINNVIVVERHSGNDNATSGKDE